MKKEKRKLIEPDVAAVYIRISTDEDLQKWSLGGQEKELAELAVRHGFKIYNIYRDTISGSKSRRPGLDQLRDDMAAGKFSVILVVDQDRLSRMEPIDWELLKHELREFRVRLVTPVQIIDFSDEDNELVSDVFNLFARHQRRKLKKAMMRGRAEAVENGNWFGKPPYGRKKIKNNRDKDLVAVDPETGPVVQQIFSMYAEGHGSRIIANELNRLGIPSPEGRVWDTCAVIRVISNPVHRGDLHRCENGRDIHIESVFEPTVTVELFDRCQKILMKRNEERTWQRSNVVTGLASGSLVCAGCSKKLQVVPIRSRYGNKRYSYYYYRHRSRGRNGKMLKPDCVAVHRVDRIDARIIEAIKIINSSPTVAGRMIGLKNTDKERKVLLTQLEALNKSEKLLALKKEKLLTLFLEDDWDREMLNKKKKAIEAELKNIVNEVQNVQSKLNLLTDVKLDREMVAEYFAVLINMDREMARQQQRRLIQALFPKIDISLNGDMRIYALISDDDVNNTKSSNFYRQYYAQGI